MMWKSCKSYFTAIVFNDSAVYLTISRLLYLIRYFVGLKLFQNVTITVYQECFKLFKLLQLAADICHILLWVFYI